MKLAKGDWKANQFDWDRIQTLSDDECCFSLSQKEVALILTYTEMIGWARRWFSIEGEDINLSEILQYQSKLERKMMSGCCPDELLGRYTSDGIYETSPDGIVWTPNPEEDPRNSWVAAPPLSGADGDSKKCASADNNRDQFKIWADDLVELLEAGTLITAIAAAIVGFIASVVFASGVGAAWGVLLFSLAAALFAEGSGDFDDAMTEDVYEDFRCILYCNMQEDGTFTEANIVQILSEISTQFSGIVETFFYSIVSTMRAIGMSNTGTLGAATADDCDDCGCDENCAEQWHALIIGGTPYASDISYASDYIQFTMNQDYGYIGTEDPAKFCFIGSCELISGSAVVTAHCPPGSVYPALSPTNPVGGCATTIEFQGVVGAVWRIHMGVCS